MQNPRAFGSKTGVHKQEFYLFNPQWAQRQPFAQLQFPQTQNCTDRSPHPQKVPSVLRARRGALPGAGAVSQLRSSGLAHDLGRTEEKASPSDSTFPLHGSATSAGFLLCRQEAKCASPAPSGTHPKALSEMGVGTRSD